MSAICGRVHRDGEPVASEIMSRMMLTLKAYGPDGSAVWCEGAAALGHQMLHITPESLQESLPWQDGLTGLAITADARLDNREDLFTALEIPSQVGRQLSDAQLIVRAYGKWEEQCPQHLLGDFAFAIWDGRQQKLFCARDIFGVRPFFYHSSPRCFLFASDLNALLAVPEVPHQINELLLAAFLQQEDTTFAQKRLTFYQDIHKLPPAHCVTVTDSQLKIQRYWSAEATPEIRLKSESDYMEVLRHLLEQSVSCRLRSAFPIGAHLSGGLDSSSIAVVAARVLRSQEKTLHGFSWSPPLSTPIEAPDDERRLVEELCQYEQIHCCYVSLTGQDLFNHRTRNFFTEPSEMLQFEQKVQAEVTSQKIRVVLSGWGGDEAISFNGRGYFAELFLKGQWWTLCQELKLRGELHGIGLRHQFLEKVLIPLLPDALLPFLESQINEQIRSSLQSVYVSPQFARKIQPQMNQLPRLPRLMRERAGVRANQYMLLEDGHLTERIESWAMSGGQNKLIYSYPLLDRRIVEFALGIPVACFFKQGWKRYLFRSATEGLLPDRVRWYKTKLEVASFAQLRSCGDEIQQGWKDMILACLQENRQSPDLAEWLDLERLEQALTGKEAPQPGFAPAVRLVTSFAKANQEAQRGNGQITSRV